MIDLSHVYFSGEGPSKEIRSRERVQTKSAIRNRRSPEAESPRALSPLLRLILRQSGLDCGAYQAKALNRRLAACLRVLKVTSEEAAMTVLQRRPELLEDSLSAILIGVSGFFRDEAIFERLRNAVLPQALEKNEALRVYSVGCSAGQELYSVAIILDELGRLETSHLLGVDCRPDAIAQARSGCFGVSDVKKVEEIRRQRYFCFKGRRVFVSPRLRQKTFWRVADFGAFRDLEPCDLILFRNVAIYLRTEYTNRVWEHLEQQLKPGGVIVTGSADRPPEILGWNREAACIYRKPPTIMS